MREQELRPQHAITDATTNETVYLPYTDEEWQELKAKQDRIKAEQEAEIAAEIDAQDKASNAKKIIDARPTDDEISSVKTVADLKDLMIRQNAALNVLLKKLEFFS